GWPAGGGNTRSWDPGPDRNERVLAGSSPPFSPHPGRSRPPRAWRASRKEGEGKRSGSAAAAVETLTGWPGRAACPPRFTKQPSWKVGSFHLLLGPRSLGGGQGVGQPEGRCEEPR
ncbi:hypothetical protein H1C71_012351, partial [Ictidomys tridecemlineatus]